MLDIAEDLNRWVEQGRAFAVATVVSVSGSAPRLPGAALAVDTEGTAIGSVSGGCVEAAVYELCRAANDDGQTLRERFGYSDADAFAVGLSCGGVIDVLITPVRPRDPARPSTGPDQDALTGVVRAALSAAVRGESAALARVAEGPAPLLGQGLLVRPAGEYEGTLGGPRALDIAAAREAAALLDAGRTGTVDIGTDGSRCGSPIRLLVESSVPAPRMIVFGAVDFAAALVRMGKFLGYHVTLCDARPVFATQARFPEADEIVVDWPHRYLADTRTDSRTVLCVLTHDAKFDLPLLKSALRLPVAYVGAMGSRRTHEDRVRSLREAGLTERERGRLRSPIGLDLGARTPEETALSIAAEIVASRRGGSGVPLTGGAIPIHHENSPPHQGQASDEGRFGSVA
ncbi:XdhC family protein [Streptomyces albipurpureus]|uniref:XdhC family protein n=1 Tax=Streptomyces albipurpureus TaxID=2897419 RepID=A0ABT0UH67_9ACTN|nr:XdhC/CoxI family protein [Streptomyces sp. CWNU-1]MCM2386965.1 XdhC family protein [Streptomyces sp. CWNU-1]